LAPGEAQALSPTEDGKMVWTPLEAVTRHPPLNADGSETLLRVTTRDGRSVDVTKAKSVLVHRDGKLVPVDGDELRVGDNFGVTAAVPETVSTLDLRTILDPKRVHGSSVITLGIDFGFLVGAFLAEGTLSESEVRISNNDPERACAWAKSEGIEYTVREDTTVVLSSTILASVLRHSCGSFNKRVPSWAFTAPPNFITGMLDGYLGRSFGSSSRSRILRDGIATLLSSHGVSTTLREYTDKLGETLYYMTLMTEESKPRLCDVVLDPVVSIEEVQPTTPWVYDLTVEGTRNMTAGNGIGLRDTFHTAGVLAHTVTQGVPRLKELIDMSANIRTPSIHINFNQPYASHEHMARMLGTGIEHTYLQEVVDTSEVVWGNTPTEDAEMIELHEATGMSNSGSDSVIRIVLDRKKMYRKKLTVEDVGVAVQTFLGGNGVVIWSEVNMLTWCVRIRVCNIDLGDTEEACAKGMCLIHDFLVDNVPVHGVNGIHRVIVRSDTIRTPNPDTGALESVKTWSADTEGSNLMKVLGLDGVDPTTTFSNDIHETLEVLGVEAATHQLLTEIRSVLSHDGAYVNDRHLQLLVDVMTRSGVLSPVTRHSMSKLGASVYTRASFEQTQEVLTWAAAMGTANTTNGVTENIMIGNPISGGTGCCDVITRPDALPKPYEQKVVGKLVRDSEKQQVVPLNRVAPPLVRPLNRATGFVGKKRKSFGLGKHETKRRTLVLHSPAPKTEDRELVFHSP
jgi:DNA-directed RNA polymerase beta' subunit